MLHWFAGAKTQDTGDVDATGYIEPPETPAPVFAVRAFKHAIFGTPGTVQPKALRRHSNTDNGKPRSNARPAMTRPKSSNDTHTLGIDYEAPEPAPLPSPTKGILMTPGTAAARRKTVSFGAHVQDNEGKRQGKSGLPDSCPGKFPSPFVRLVEAEEEKTETIDKGRGRNKLTEKLEQVREESAKRKSTSSRQYSEPVEDTGVVVGSTDDMPEYWKIMFEQYRERSERECRKLLSKQRAAKSFAREKDEQLMETVDQLRHEKKKVDRLEKQVADLQAQLKEYQDKIRAPSPEEQNIKTGVAQVKRDSVISGYRRHGDLTTSANAQAQESEKSTRDTVLRKRASKEHLLNHMSKSTAAVQNGHARPRARNRRPLKKETEDVWAPSAEGTSLLPSKPAAIPTAFSQAGDHIPTEALNPLEINTLPQEPFRRPRTKLTENLSVAIQDSSTFLPDAENERPNVLNGTPVPIRSPVLSPVRSHLRTAPSTMKENGPPTPKSHRRPQRDKLDPEPHARASAERAEMDDVMEEARLRLAAIGRKVS